MEWGLIATGTLAFWARVYSQRSKPDAQKEARIAAEQIGSILQPLFPVSWAALTGRFDEAEESQ